MSDSFDSVKRLWVDPLDFVGLICDGDIPWEEGKTTVKGDSTAVKGDNTTVKGDNTTVKGDNTTAQIEKTMEKYKGQYRLAHQVIGQRWRMSSRHTRTKRTIKILW